MEVVTALFFKLYIACQSLGEKKKKKSNQKELTHIMKVQ